MARKRVKLQYFVGLEKWSRGRWFRCRNCKFNSRFEPDYESHRNKCCSAPCLKKAGYLECRKEALMNKAIWQDLKRRIYRKYGKRCMRCKYVGRELHIDHIKPKSLFPELTLVFDNLQVLCRWCNEEKSNLNCNDYRTHKEAA